MRKLINYKKDGVLDKCNIQLLKDNDGSVGIKMEIEKEGIQVEENGGNYFQVLNSLRKRLNSRGVFLLCNGTSVNVYPSTMQFDMGGGEKAYRLRMGCHAQLTDIVEIFDYDRDEFEEGSIEEQTEFYEKWILSKKKLDVRFPKYSVENIRRNSKHVYFWGHQPSQYGVVDKSCLSQWWPCNFIDNDGVEYCSAEQWMMAEKARVFSDRTVLEDILKSDNPKRIKELGRTVSFFDETVWRERAYDAVVEGNLLKFSQDLDLKNYLVSTKDSVLVEASPNDRIWGIGLESSAEGIGNSTNWLGQNLLGFALMEVRDIIRNNHVL